EWSGVDFTTAPGIAGRSPRARRATATPTASGTAAASTIQIHRMAWGGTHAGSRMKASTKSGHPRPDHPDKEQRPGCGDCDQRRQPQLLGTARFAEERNHGPAEYGGD